MLRFLEDLFEELDRFNLYKTDDKASSLLGPIQFELEAAYDDGCTTVPDLYIDDLRKSAEAVRQVMIEEARHSFLYPVESIAEMVDFGVSADLDPALPPEVLDHLEEAARCWRVGFYLAALFPAFTATELVTKYYYRIIKNEKPPKRATWGALVNKHLTQPDIACPPKLISTLRRLVKHYRNRMIHEGLNLDPDNARTIYTVCAQASRGLIYDLWQRSKVHRPPTKDQTNIMLRAMALLEGKTDQQIFVALLSGQMLPKIESEGWHLLPDYGAFDGFPYEDVWYKVDCCIGSLFRRGEQLMLVFANEEFANEGQRLVVDSLFQWSAECLETDIFDDLWPKLEMIPANLKQTYLDDIVSEGIVELIPFLNLWLSRETSGFGSQIVKALDALGSGSCV